MHNFKAARISYVLGVILALLVPMVISCSKNSGDVTGPGVHTQDGDGMPYWADFCFDIVKEGGGTPTWDFKSYAYWVTNPNSVPPGLGNKIDESDVNETPWIVNINHNGGDYVAFWSECVDDTNTYPWKNKTGYTVMRLPYQDMEVDGLLVFPYAD